MTDICLLTLRSVTESVYIVLALKKLTTTVHSYFILLACKLNICKIYSNM